MAYLVPKKLFKISTELISRWTYLYSDDWTTLRAITSIELKIFYPRQDFLEKEIHPFFIFVKGSTNKHGMLG